MPIRVIEKGRRGRDPYAIEPRKPSPQPSDKLKPGIGSLQKADIEKNNKINQVKAKYASLKETARDELTPMKSDRVFSKFRRPDSAKEFYADKPGSKYEGLAKQAMQNRINYHKNQKKVGGMAKKYSTGMTLADMKPYGGSYVKKKAEMKASQTENVKQLTTSDDAYSPEKMFVVTRGTKKGNRATPTRIRVTDDWNAKKIVDRQNSKGMNTKSVASYRLPPAYERDYLRRQQVLQNMRDKPRSYSGPTKKMPVRRTDLKPKRMMPKFKSGVMVNKPMGYKSGTMVKARGCKLGRTRPTKMY